MPYYSVHVHGQQHRALAMELRDTFGGRLADHTGHPIFNVRSHRPISDFRATIEVMLPEGHSATIRKISKRVFDRVG